MLRPQTHKTAGQYSAARAECCRLIFEYQRNIDLDLLPCFGTKLSMICAKERGRKYVEKQSHGGADDRGAEAIGGRA